MKRSPLKRKTPLARKSQLRPGDRFRVGRYEFTLPAGAARYGAEPFVRAAEDDAILRGDITIAEAAPIVARRQRDLRAASRRTKPRTRSKYATRTRDTPFMLFVKRQPCAAAFVDDMPWLPDYPNARTLGAMRCDGRVEADHQGRRPTGRKAADDTCVPLCKRHHAARTAHAGLFRDATKAQMRVWMDSWIAEIRERYARGAVDLDNLTIG